MRIPDYLKGYAKAVTLHRKRQKMMNSVTLGELIEALQPLAEIADKFDQNQLSGLAQKVGCCGLNETPPECMVIAWDRFQRPLLTVADCLKAREVLHGKEGQGVY